jgi:hypothetical protein
MLKEHKVPKEHKVGLVDKEFKELKVFRMLKEHKVPKEHKVGLVVKEL